jgi:hypothetical protein
MFVGIALHVNHAELNIGIWEKAAGDREETREVVLNDKQDPPQAALSEVAKDELPIFEVFATEPGSATEHALSSVAKETDSEIDGGLTKAIGFANLDILSIEIEDTEVGIKRARIAQLQFFDKGFSDAIEILIRDRESHAVKSLFGRIERTA